MYMKYIVTCLLLQKDLPLGLMDDIYDWLTKYGQRIDEVEEVIPLRVSTLLRCFNAS